MKEDKQAGIRLYRVFYSINEGNQLEYLSIDPNMVTGCCCYDPNQPVSDEDFPDLTDDEASFTTWVMEKSLAFGGCQSFETKEAALEFMSYLNTQYPP